MTHTESIAVRYVETRDRVIQLKAERAAKVCDFEEVYDAGETTRPALRTRAPFDQEEDRVGGRGVGGAAKMAPCWRFVVVDEDGGSKAIGDITEEGWCEPCRERARLHTEMRAAMRRRTSLLSALISSTRAHLMPRREKPRRESPPVMETPPTPIRYCGCVAITPIGADGNCTVCGGKDCPF